MHCKRIKIEKYFPQNKKNNLTDKIFLSLLQENLTWIKNMSENKTTFHDILKTFPFFSYFKKTLLIPKQFS